MDQITNNFLQVHKREYEIENWNDQDAFEHFVIRCIVNKYTTERFEPEALMTKPGEIGIDGIAICVNDRLITSIDEWNDVNKDGIEVRFVFIQAKTSDNFKGDEIGTFISGVKSFFEEEDLRMKTNQEIEALIEIKNKIYENSINLKNSPSVEMYYVCCGKWNSDTNLQKRIDIDIKPLKDSSNFSNVVFYPYDAVKIQTAYRELKKKISKQFTMDKKVSFAQIDGVRQAYIGLVKCRDYVSIVVDSEGNILTNIFEDNVRDFQGYNQVNSEIKNTIEDSKDQQRFAILNNGITIVAKGIDVEGDLITIHDYQIVNGCQTSYVLYNNKDLLIDNSYVVVKIIEINDDEVSDRVIFTTNRQTEVKSEAFISINEFQKGLEEYYNSIPIQYRLYYERRSKQYDLKDDIQKDKVVTIPNQIKSYLAMFLNEPQSVHRYYGELIETYKNRLFRENDSFALYYIASYYQYCVTNELRRRKSDRQYKLLKPYILLAMRLLIADDKIIAGNRKSQDKVAKRFFEVRENQKDFIRYFNTSISCIEECVKNLSNIPETQIHRSRDLTNALIKKCQGLNVALKAQDFLKNGDKVRCVVSYINDSFIYVKLLTSDQREYGHIHISKVARKYIEDLREEAKVGDTFQARIIEDNYDSEFGWEMSLIDL